MSLTRARGRSASHLETLTYWGAASGGLVNGVLRTPDGVAIAGPTAMRGSRKAAALSESLVHSLASRSLEGQVVAKKVEFSERPSRA